MKKKNQWECLRQYLAMQPKLASNFRQIFLSASASQCWYCRCAAQSLAQNLRFNYMKVQNWYIKK